jgi:hypothetical protein
MKVSHADPLDAPLLTPEQFRTTPEFRKFKGIMRRLLKVPKSDLDEMVRTSKERSPRVGNPNAPGRKRLPKSQQDH